jgi:predicted signal transduction protein with EAL and GGDEF domain
MLQDLGCTMAQGYLIARPTTSDLTTWLSSGNRRLTAAAAPSAAAAVRTPSGLIVPA